MLNLNKEKRVIAYLPRRSGKTTSIYKSLEDGNNLIIDPFMKTGMKAKEIFQQFYPNDLDKIRYYDDNWIVIKDKFLSINNKINDVMVNSISFYKIDNLFIDEFGYFDEKDLYFFMENLKSKGIFDKLNKIILLSTFNNYKYTDADYVKHIGRLINSKQEKFFYDKIIFGVNLPEHLFKL